MPPVVSRRRIRKEFKVTRKALAAVLPRMAKKAMAENHCVYHVCALAISSKNELLGICVNNRRLPVIGRRGVGLHAEIKLIRRYGKNISKIYIIRMGGTGNALPIAPCENCSKVAAKYGIKIIPVHEELSLEEIL